MNLFTLGVALLGSRLALWLTGGVLLRICGLLLVLAGALGMALQHDPSGIVIAAIGVLFGSRATGTTPCVATPTRARGPSS